MTLLFEVACHHDLSPPLHPYCSCFMLLHPFSGLFTSSPISFLLHRPFCFNSPATLWLERFCQGTGGPVSLSGGSPLTCFRDLFIAHPPSTVLSSSGNSLFARQPHALTIATLLTKPCWTKATPLTTTTPPHLQPRPLPQPSPSPRGTHLLELLLSAWLLPACWSLFTRIPSTGVSCFPHQFAQPPQTHAPASRVTSFWKHIQVFWSRVRSLYLLP